MARPNPPPRSEAEAELRREAEQQQRILADRLAEIGQGEGGLQGRGALELPPGAADDSIAESLYLRLRELRRQIAALRRDEPLPGPRPTGGWDLD